MNYPKSSRRRSRASEISPRLRDLTQISRHQREKESGLLCVSSGVLECGVYRGTFGGIVVLRDGGVAHLLDERVSVIAIFIEVLFSGVCIGLLECFIGIRRFGNLTDSPVLWYLSML